METHISTTPFGGRPLSRAMMAAQSAVRDCAPGTFANKWQVWRNLAIAKDRLGVSDRALAVLNALLSFHQATALQAGDDLVVYPSNRELSLRAHGMAPATLRRHLAVLVDAGLVIRRDSPNGKRYARRGDQGLVDQAFGFDLAPLVARAEDFEALAVAVTADLRAEALLREQITILRRDIGKTIALGLEEGLSTTDWTGMACRLSILSQGLLRRLDKPALEARASALRDLYQDASNALETNAKVQKKTVKESQIERHIQNSKPECSNESEPAYRKAGPKGFPEPQECEAPQRIYPLAMVLDACPVIYDWHAGSIKTWPDFIQAAQSARGALGISPSAFDEACHIMGTSTAAVCVAAILQKAASVRNPGGYLRALCQKAEEGHFSLGPILMALLRAKIRDRRAA